MDSDVFPNSIEYWGPNGMVFYRNVQVRWEPVQGPLSVAVAIERPGSTQDTNGFEETLDIQNVSTRFPMPDFTGHIRYEGDWGHVQLAGIARYIKWDPSTPVPPKFRPRGRLGRQPEHEDQLPGRERHQASGCLRPGDAGVHERWRARHRHRNERGQPGGDQWHGAANRGRAGLRRHRVVLAPDELRRILVRPGRQLFRAAAGRFQARPICARNLLVHPLDTFFFGPEFQWGERQNKSDGWTYGDYRLQFSAQYKFSKTLPL